VIARSPLIAALLLGLLAGGARADRVPTPTLGWALTQLVPSPGFVTAASGDVAFTMRWQLTPLLYSFGARPEVTPWRSLVAEPMLRYGGSLELFAAGEYVGRGDASDRWGLRSGARLYLPLIQHGENAALSIGASHLYLGGEHGMGIELGCYVLYGVLGLQLTYAPPLPAGESVTVNFSVRYF
jgi:hypothetical protein